MKKLRTSILIAILTFITGMIAVLGWLWIRHDKAISKVISVTQFDERAFSNVGLNRLTELANISLLRTENISGDDLEVRIWRGAYLGNTEAIFIKRVDGQWTGKHLAAKTGESYDDISVQVDDLPSPKSGWKGFWSTLVDEGLLELPLSPEVDCHGLDPLIYTVEINQNNTYRNYQYPIVDEKCRETKQMAQIGETIGIEFYSGENECSSKDEWFACEAKNKQQRYLSLQNSANRKSVP